ncbi:kelch repeat-containing protein [Sorangium sp. So ce1389]|uniref:Kelch repeat-containing protein n=1 Tax=Sorangium sp. So ce1389 TaxID=3133336 RepID=UPI003F625467
MQDSFARPPCAALLRSLRATALLLAGCGAEPEDTSAAALRAHFPDHAEAVLSARDAFVPVLDGFRLAATEQGGAWIHAARPEVELPLDGSGVIRFRRSTGREIRVRELGAAGEGRTAERAVSYPRVGGTSFWTAIDGGVEEWLLLDEGLARDGEAVAAWHVEGATLRARGDAVELLDEQSGAPVLRVTAPRAHAASGRPVVAALTVRGARIELSVDAGGEAVLVDPVWEPTGRMNVARNGHTATLLPDGRVLVAGGSELGPHVEASAELYDPTTDTWTLTAPMSTPRVRHTATLLPSGQVLVTGGYERFAGASAILASAELYDPPTETWVPASPMQFARSMHTATLLPDAQVLVVGGPSTPIGGISDAELYDPATDTWAGAESMFSPRTAGHTATLLSNGQVLVAGGHGDLTAELYDPATSIWARTGFMSTVRYQHTATLLSNGLVLVAGGDYVHVLDTTELYDPTTGLWTPAAPMSTPRTLHTATLLPSGKVLGAGGSDNRALASAELYDPATDSWSPTASMRVAHAEHTATLLPTDLVLVAGASTYAERYHGSLGTACTSDADCASSVCADGVCCASRCAEPCHTCARSASLGRCMPQPKGSDIRGDCAHEGCDGACDGFGSCSAVLEGDACIPGECSDETHSLLPVRCPADGATCQVLTSDARELADCTPYRCDRADGTCKTRCSSLQDCAPGFACNLSSSCVPPPPAVTGGCSVTEAAPEVAFESGLGALLLALLATGRRRSSVLRVNRLKG